MTEASKTSALSICSLVFGVLGIFGGSILTGVPALILGHTARFKIKRSGGSLSGGGLAIAGIIMGYLSIALLIAFGVFADQLRSKIEMVPIEDGANVFPSAMSPNNKALEGTGE